jgi:hypothetical protein
MSFLKESLNICIFTQSLQIVQFLLELFERDHFSFKKSFGFFDRKEDTNCKIANSISFPK